MSDVEGACAPSLVPSFAPSPDPPGAGARPEARVVVSVCTTCRAAGAAADDARRPGEALIASLASGAASAGVELRAVQCLSVCKRPCSVAFTAAGRYTYVFGDLDPDRDAGAILEGAAVYATTAHGYMLWRERPEAFRRGIVARIPPLDWSEPAGRHPR